MIDVTAIEFADGVAAQQRHRAFDLGPQQMQAALDARLAAGCQWKQVGATNAARRRPECQRLDDMRAPTDAAVADDFEAIVQRISDARNAIYRRRCRFQLAPPVIRQHDRRRARVCRPSAILYRLHTLDDQRTVPLRRQPFDILPGQRAIKLAVDVLDDTAVDFRAGLTAGDVDKFQVFANQGPIESARMACVTDGAAPLELWRGRHAIDNVPLAVAR